MVSVRKQLLVNAIQSSVLIVSQSMYTWLDIHESSVPFTNQPDPPMQDWVMALGIVKLAIIELVNTIEAPFTI